MARSFILVFILLYVSTCNYAAQNVVKSNGKLKFPNITEVDVSSTLTSTFDGKGLEPWYDVAKSFVHTVQKDDLPYDEFKKIDDGNFEAPEFLKGWELPFLVVFAIGVLFALIVPIVGFCFCCCRCCGNCGGEMVQKTGSKDNLKRAIFGVALSIITLLMFVGCLMAFVANDRISDTVKSYEETPIRAIRDAEQYFNQTLQVVTENVIGNVLDVLDIIRDDVKDLPKNIADSVKEALSDAVRAPLNSVVELGKETEKMGDLLEKINSTTEELQSRFKNLTMDIENVKNELTSLCSISSSVNCSSEGIDPNSITTGANFFNLPDVGEQLNNIVDINNENLTQKAEEGLKEFDTIDETIRKESQNYTNKIINETNDAKSEFEKNIEQDIVDKVNEEVLDRTDGLVKDIEDAFDDYVNPYDKYRYYAGVALTCLVLIPVVLMAVGLLCGICGLDKQASPTERGGISNMGGNCLMAAVGFMFIFVLFLMLFTALCFVFGAHLEKGCYSVREETLYSDYLDNPKYWNGDYILAKSLYNNGSIELKIATILSSCRNNDAIFQAIQGHNRWNLTDKFSVKDKLGDIEDNLNGFNVSVRDQNILDQDTKDSLTDLSNSGVNNISFEQFLNETGKDVVNNNEIDGLQRKLNDTGQEGFKNVSIQLEAIQIDANAMRVLSDNLDQNVKELKELGGNISLHANDILYQAEKAESVYKENVNENINKQVVKFTDEILGYVDQTTNWAVKIVEYDIGRCRILTDVYDAVVNLVCRDTVYPFNGYWFSIGFCLFFYIPAIILCIKLAKHYRRMRFEEGFDRHDGMEMADRNKPWLNQGNAVYPK